MRQADTDFVEFFNDEQAVARYTDGPPLFMPGYFDLHRMTGVLLAEKVPETGRILVLGAGGGLELKALAELYPGWTFEGVDPAEKMLALAARTMGEHASRAELVEGYIDAASDGPFDGAICLLTLHFIEAEERERTLREIRKRLRPGAPFVAAHSSFPQDGDDRARWLSRYAGFAINCGVPPEDADNARQYVDKAVALLTPEHDEALMTAAGFQDVTLFYAAFTWRGWVAYA